MPFRLYTNVAGKSVPKTIDYLCRKDLLQIDGLYAKISKLRYELYDLKKEDCFELCGTCVVCKDEGQRLELKEKEKWYVEEVKTVKAIVATVVWTRTRLLKVEYKQWKSP